MPDFLLKLLGLFVDNKPLVEEEVGVVREVEAVVEQLLLFLLE